MEKHSYIMILPMQQETLEGVSAVEQGCFSTPWSYKMLETELENETARFFVALKQGECVGYAGMYNVCGECSIANIGVLPPHRRQGIARRLLDRLIQCAKDEDADFLTLEVRKSNAAAIGLYAAKGFTTVGERKDYYTSPRENALLMTLYLKERQS